MSETGKPPGETTAGKGKASETDPQDLTQQIEDSQQLNIDLGVRLEQIRKMKALQAERNELEQDYLSATQQRIQLMDIEVKKAEETLEKLIQGKGNYEEQVQLLNEITDSLQKQGPAAQKVSKQIQQMLAAGDYEKAVTAIQEFSGQLKDAGEFGRKLEGQMNKVARSIGITAKASDTGLGSAVKMMIDLTQGGAQAAMKIDLLKSSIVTMFSPLNLLVNLMQKLFERALDIDKADMALRRTLNTTEQFGTVLTEMQVQTAGIGAELKDLESALGALRDNFSAFQPDGKFNATLASGIVRLDQAGVSMATTTNIMDGMSKGFGMAEEDALNFTTSVIRGVSAMGISMEKASKMMEQNFANLAEYGSQTKQVFIELAAASKAMGVEMSSLISLGAKFDTFDSAANHAAKLNSVLGSNISAMQMLNSTRSEQILLLQQELAMQDVENMDMHTQRYLKEALGLKSVEELRRVAGMDMVQFQAHQDKAAEAAENEAEAQKQLQEDLRAAVPAVHAMAQAMDELLAGFEPLTDMLVSFVQVLNPFLGLLARNADLLVPLIPLYYGWKMLTYASTEAVGSLLAIRLKNFALEVREFAAKKMMQIAQRLGITITWADVAAKTALGAANMYAFGAIILIIGALYLLWKAFQKRGSPPLYAMAGVMAIGVIALGTAMYFFGPAIWPVVAALAALAFGIAAIFYSINLLIQSLTGFFQLMIDNIGILPQMAGALYLIAGGLVAVGAAGTLSALGMAVGAIGLAALFASIKLFGIPMNQITKAGETMMSMGEGMLAFSTGLSGLAREAAALQEIAGDGIVVMAKSGGASSLIVGTEGAIKNIDVSNINVKVDIPEIKAPEVNVKVYVSMDGESIASKIKKVMVS